MNPQKLRNGEIKVLQALRAGAMDSSELQDRFPGGYPMQKLLKLGYVVNSQHGYQLTEAGKAACPTRRATEKATHLPPVELKPSIQAKPVDTINMNAVSCLTIKQPEVIMPTHSNVAKQIRDIITENPGIEHKALVGKMTNDSADEAVIKKAYNMIAYTLKCGGFKKIDDYKVGTLEKTKHYYTEEAYAKRLKNAQENITNNIPTLAQHHEAKQPPPKKEKPMTINSVPEQPVISIQFAVQLPDMPDRLKLVGIRKTNLDDAIASGESYTVDVATLDDHAVDALCVQWATKFKAHVQARKQQ